MTKISVMYKWSGGTDYRHVCKECVHCIRIKCRCKCRIYGTEGDETDWKESFIACRHFNGPLADGPRAAKTPPDLVYTGCRQISLADLPGWEESYEKQQSRS